MRNNFGNFIFGYGGLILAESRHMTLDAEVKATPVIIKGFERFWGFTAPQHHLTTVSLRVNETSVCAGVIFPVTQEQLVRLDEREKGYTRVELLKDYIQFLQPQDSINEGTIYTYIAKVNNVPSLEYPITQSDVDAILTGCLRDYGEVFAREVVQTTSGWEGPWVDDRKTPRYPWSLHNGHFARIIDKILKEMTPIPIDRSGASAK